MRHITRQALPAAVAHRMTVYPANKAGQSAQAQWRKFRRTATYRSVKATLVSMSYGVDRCFYCEDSAGTAVEHHQPLSLAHASAFDWRNQLLACSTCNSHYKRDQWPLAEDGTALLVDPTTSDPLDHLAFSPVTGRWLGMTDAGTETESVLGLNRQALEVRRRHEWRLLRLQLSKLAELAPDPSSDGDVATAVAAVELTPDRSVSSLLLWLLRSLDDADDAYLEQILGAEALDAARTYRLHLAAIDG